MACAGLRSLSVRCESYLMFLRDRGNESKRQRQAQMRNIVRRKEKPQSPDGVNSRVPPLLIYTLHEALAGGWDA